MEYMQMTLNDWLGMKQSLERELSNLKTGFIRVGYVLRKIDESRGYEQDGYKSVAEFAKAEYGLSASTVSRFMAINEKFSLDGYSERLDPKYIGFRQSIMGEMLGLPDQDIDLVTPETSRQDVRELKQFNRQEPEKGIADDLRNLIETYFRENRDELNELYSGNGQATQEILNPSGNRVFRKGMFMMFFYPDTVKIKKFGGEPKAYSWEEFREMVDAVFGSSAGPDTYRNYFEGGDTEETVIKSDESVAKRDESVAKTGENVAEPEEAVPDEDAQEEEETEEETGKEEMAEEDDPAEGAEDAPEADTEEAADSEDTAAEGEEDIPAEGAEDAPAEEEPEPEPVKIMPAPEGPETFAPAQKPAESKTYQDAKAMMKGLNDAFSGKDWDRMLSLLEGLEPAIRKLKKEE